MEDPGFGRTVALAHYLTAVRRKGDLGGIMPGTPAILARTFGEGRYVLFSGHPEFHRRLGNNPMIVDAARCGSETSFLRFFSDFPWHRGWNGYSSGWDDTPMNPAAYAR